MSNYANHFYEFGRFRIDAANRLVLRDGETLPLAPKAVDTLLALIRHGGEVLKKEELMSLVWPDTVVEEGNLTQNIYLLRKTLGEGPDGHNYIETLPRRGYRFTGEVRETIGGEQSNSTPPGREKVHQEAIEAEGNSEKHNQVAKRAGQEEGEATGSKVSLSRPRAFASPTILLLAACLLFAGLALYYFASSNRSKTADTAGPAIQSIAVLPFKPLNATGGEEDLGVGLSDALITQLSNVRRIVVRPTSAVLKYGNAIQDPLAAGRELSVDAVIDGRYQLAEGRLRVTVQLISVRDGAPLWAGKFDEPLTGMLSVQDAIAGRVTDALALKLTTEEQKLLTKRFTENPDAYQAYLKGRYYWSRRATPALEESIKYFEEALQHDPEDSLAYAGLADAYVSLAARYDSDGRSQSDALPQAKAAALHALKLNELLAEAHTSLAVVRERYEWDWAGAESEYRRAIELNPNYAHAHQV
nr:winged helix-turn-helix domain-containing protein [Acidobacteriota bacterium]